MPWHVHGKVVLVCQSCHWRKTKSEFVAYIPGIEQRSLQLYCGCPKAVDTGIRSFSSGTILVNVIGVATSCVSQVYPSHESEKKKQWHGYGIINVISFRAIFAVAVKAYSVSNLVFFEIGEGRWKYFDKCTILRRILKQLLPD